MTGLKIIDGTPTAMSKYLREKSNSGMCEFPNSPLTIGKAITYEDLEKALQSSEQKHKDFIEQDTALIWDYRNGDITFNELLDKRNKLKEKQND